MRKISFLLLSLLIVSAASAQTKKELRKQKQMETKKKNLALINNKTWVIEADMVYDRQMNPYNVSPTTNFMMLEGDMLTIQLDFKGLVDWNGIGGITMEGKVSKYEIKENKDAKPVDLTVYALGSAMGNVTVFASVDSYGMGRITYSDAQGTRLTINGYFYSFEESRVYKSRRAY